MDNDGRSWRKTRKRQKYEDWIITNPYVITLDPSHFLFSSLRKNVSADTNNTCLRFLIDMLPNDS